MSNLSPTQQEQLLNVGTYLQGVRENQGRSVDEVATQIFIRPALLRALEAGNWDILPEPVFVQGFIRRYADALGLDGKAIAQEFEPTPVAVLPDPKQATNGVDGVIHQQDKHGLKVLAKAEPTPSITTRRTRSVNGAKVGAWLSSLVALVLVGGGIWAISQSGVLQSLGGSGVESPPPEADESDVASPEEAAPAEAVPTEAPESAATTDAPITVSVTLTGDSWMRVSADGEEIFEGILPSGTAETWTAESELALTSGNAGAVQLSLNGATAIPLGEPGTVRRLTFTPDTSPDAIQNQ